MATVLKQPAAPKRIGRPFKTPPKGKRAPLSLLVRPEIKRLIDARAKANSRTQSQEAEMMIEKAFAFDDWLAGQKRTLEEMGRGNVEAELRRLGYPMQRQILDGKVWKFWAEPGYPAAPEPSGFVEPTNE